VSLGFLLWALSEPLTGSTEPWDTPYPLYALTMLIGGFVIGLVAPGRLITGYGGIWLGQISALAWVPWLQVDGWYPMGVVATAIGSLLALPGLIAGGVLRFLCAMAIRWF
jgi:hypothetical protein